MKAGRTYTVLYMVVLSCLFGAAIAGLSIVSEPAIERNERFLQQRAYVSVFGLGDVEEMSDGEVLQTVERFVQIVPPAQALADPETGTTFPILRAYEDEGHTRLLGIAFKFRGLGFWAPIEGWLALTPDRRETLGIVIVQHSETPGLGGRIQEPIFTEPFEQGVLVSPPDEPDAKFIRISGSEPPEGTEIARRHVDAITGATQTCMAMEKILDEALRGFSRAWQARSQEGAAEVAGPVSGGGGKGRSHAGRLAWGTVPKAMASDYSGSVD
jgi:Na+-transporting NADH:ubiquinone oxidoreductase subunit C